MQLFAVLSLKLDTTLAAYNIHKIKILWRANANMEIPSCFYSKVISFQATHHDVTTVFVGQCILIKHIN